MKAKQIYIAVLIVVFVASATWADETENDKNIQKGNVFIGGSSTVGGAFGAVSSDDKNVVERTHWLANAGISGGYFIIDGLELGPVLLLDVKSVDAEDHETRLLLRYGMGAQVGYFFDVHRVVAPYGMLAFAFMLGSEDIDEQAADKTYKMQGYLMEPRVGVDFFFAESAAFNTHLFCRYAYYEITDMDAPGDADYSVMNVGLALGVHAFF